MIAATGAATSRRRLLAAAGGLAAMGSLAGFRPGLAAAALAEPALPDPALPGSTWQGAGFYRFSLGDLQLATVSDGTFLARPVQPLLAPDAPPSAFAETLHRSFLPADRAGIQVSALFVDTGRQKILIDAGAGSVMGDGLGQLVRNLGRAGIAPEAIDLVVISHAHIDHLAGAFDAAGAPVFPNAGYVIGQKEWEFWHRADIRLGDRLPDAAGRIQATRTWLAAIEGRVRMVRQGQEVVPGVTALAAFGHSAGQLAFLLESRGESLFYTADLVHHPVLGLQHPEWHVGFDDDPVLAVAARRQALERAVVDRLLVQAPHFPFPGLGHVVRRGGTAYGWEPVFWQW
ncbi:MBL fold metallo-hydrolase [Geminicoccus roseus]|uniref:MBL fold metallo-hydrolase n=1 Tax=Geminicoccus roseus TaxID=404900 RepID=UPI0006887A50|nr:MBL fold metallo-hydrolase [Geminicoccus roseus]